MNTKQILRKLLEESKITRVADTDKQEEALSKIEEWAEKYNIPIRVGTKIGRYPQTVILDIKYQDNAIYVGADGTIEIFDTEIEDYDDYEAPELFRDAVYKRYPHLAEQK